MCSFMDLIINVYIILVPPGQPTIVNVDSIGATWAHIGWEAPSRDLASAVDGSGLVNVTTDNSNTSFNVTGLLPATNYSFSVVAVTEGGDVVARSNESESSQATTGLTGLWRHQPLCT